MNIIKRLFLAILILAAFLGIATLALEPWFSSWGATSAEAAMPLPGDELVPEAQRTATIGITIQASPEQVWPWLAQMGAGRGGLYSYSWFERLINCPIVNLDRIIPELQNPQVGDEVRLCPGDFGPPPFHIATLDPGRVFIYGVREPTTADWHTTYQYSLLPLGDGTTRLLMRERTAGIWALDPLLQPGYFVMQRRGLQGLRERTEGQIQPEWQTEIELLLWLAGFAGFGLGLTLLLFRRDWRRPAVTAAGAGAVLLVLVFGQPPWWGSALGVGLIYAGLVWALRPSRLTSGRELERL